MKEKKQLYIKQGRRYYPFNPVTSQQYQLYYEDSIGEMIPICEETQTWYDRYIRPKDGIWNVSRNGSSCKWIGDYDMPKFRIQLEKYRDIILEAINEAFEKCDDKYLSRDDIATALLDEFGKRESKFNESEDK